MSSSRSSPSWSPRKRRHSPSSSSFSATCLVALGALGGVLMSWSFVPLERWLLLRGRINEMPPPLPTPPPKKQKLLISEWDDQEPPQVLVDLLFDRSHAVMEKSLPLQPTHEFMAAQPFVAPPTASQKTFFVAGWKEVHPMVRALRNLGWTRVNDPQDARIVYFYEEARNLRPNATQPWQRPSWTYQGLHWWDDAVVYDILHQQLPQGSPYFRETYNLESPTEFSIFLSEIRTNRDHFEGRAWVVKEPDLIHPHNGDFLNVSDGDGTHYTILPPHSSALQKFLDDPGSFVGLINTTMTTNSTATRNNETAMNSATAITLEEEEVLPKSTFQSYVCQPLRWKDGRPFTIRVFWFIASLDPLIIFYIDGHIRMDTSPEYQMGQVPSVQEFSRDYWYQAFTEAHPLDDLREIVGGTVSMTHIRYQLRHAITHLADAFSHDAFVAYPKGGPQDAFQLYAADFMVDQSFGVHYLRTVEEPVLDENYYFQLNMNHELFHGMVRILEQIWEKQLERTPIFPLKDLEPWEVVWVSDGRHTFRFEYDDAPTSTTAAETCDLVDLQR